MKKLATLCLSGLASIALAALPAQGISTASFSDFEDGTIQGWSHGAQSPNPTQNIADGGPTGAGDNYLYVTANGYPSGPGSKLTTFNSGPDWTGDYLGNNVVGISMYVKNFGYFDMQLRLLFSKFSPTSGASEGAYISSQGISLAAKSDWIHVLFPIAQADLVGFGGYDTVMSGVSEIRLLHNTVAAFGGPGGAAIPSVEAYLGVDSITPEIAPNNTSTPIPEPASLLLLGTGLVGLIAWRRR